MIPGLCTSHQQTCMLFVVLYQVHCLFCFGLTNLQLGDIEDSLFFLSGEGRTALQMWNKWNQCCAGCLSRHLEDCALNFKHAVKCYRESTPDPISRAFNLKFGRIFTPFWVVSFHISFINGDSYKLHQCSHCHTNIVN